MNDPDTNAFAVFDEPVLAGDPFDPNSTRNAPLNDLAHNLAATRFNVDLDYLEVLSSGTKTITHPAVAGLGAAVAMFAAKYATNASSDDQQLVDLTAFGLGEAPFAIAIALGVATSPGMPVVTNTDGGAWYATAYSRSGELRVGAKATIGASNLAATGMTYGWLVFKAPPATSGALLLDWDPAAGALTLAKGKWRSDRQYLLVAPDGSPFGFAMGRTIDLNNGAPKSWRPDGTSYAPVPSTLKSFLPFGTYGGSDLGGETTGAAMSYGGSGSAPTAVLVQAP